MPKRLLAPLACALTAACASWPGDYPSLEVRDAERVSGTLQPAEPYVAPPLAPEAQASVAELAAQAQAAHDSFRGKLPAARSAVSAARGAAAGSDAWALASVAIAGLETERSRTMLPLAELDRLAVDRATETGDGSDLAGAQQQVAALVEEETAAIDELLGVLGG